MISTNKYVKLLGSTDEEVDKIIKNMSEKDAKDFLARLIKCMNEQKRQASHSFIEPIEKSTL